MDFCYPYPNRPTPSLLTIAKEQISMNVKYSIHNDPILKTQFNEQTIRGEILVAVHMGHSILQQ